MKNRVLHISFYIALLGLFSFRNEPIFDFSLHSKTKLYDSNNKTYTYIPELIAQKKITVLVFHSVNCPFNSANQPKIDYLIQKFKTDSVKFIYVNANSFENQPNNPIEEVEQFVDKCNCSYILDYQNVLRKIFGIDKNSTCVVCSRINTQEINYYYEGPIDDNPQDALLENKILEKAIQNALLNIVSDFDPVETGCRILSH